MSGTTVTPQAKAHFGSSASELRRFVGLVQDARNDGRVSATAFDTLTRFAQNILAEMAADTLV